MPRPVRPYTRTDPRTGRPVSVRRHSRAGNPQRKRGPNLRHAGRLGRRSLLHAKRGRKGRAAGVAALALGEVVAFFTLNGTSLILALVAGVLIGLSVLLAK
jgi:uncharacterized protein (DUF2062 family)